MAKDHSPVKTLVHADALSSSSKNSKPPAKNKSSLIYDLRKNPDALLALLKWAEEAIANQGETKASFEESVAQNPYFPYDQERSVMMRTTLQIFNMIDLIWPAQRPKMLHYLLRGQNSLLFSTFDDDVLKRRFPMFPTKKKILHGSKAFGHTKITLASFYCSLHCSLFAFTIRYTIHSNILPI